MYTNYNSNLEKNQMLTPPTIGLTTSIVNDKLNNLNLEGSSSSSSVITYNPYFRGNSYTAEFKPGEISIYDLIAGEKWRNTQDPNFAPKYVDMFSDNDPDKFYLYDFDLTLNIESTCDQSQFTCANAIKTLYFNISYTQKVYIMFNNEYINSENVIKGSGNVILKGNYKPWGFTLLFNVKNVDLERTEYLTARLTPTVVVSKRILI